MAAKAAAGTGPSRPPASRRLRVCQCVSVILLALVSAACLHALISFTGNQRDSSGLEADSLVATRVAEVPAVQAASRGVPGDADEGGASGVDSSSSESGVDESAPEEAEGSKEGGDGVPPDEPEATEAPTAAEEPTPPSEDIPVVPASIPAGSVPSEGAHADDDDAERYAPFAGDEGKKLERWGIGGPEKGGIANETGAAGYAPYLHRPQERIMKNGQWVALERMLGAKAAPVKKGKPSLYAGLKTSFDNHETFYKAKGCFGTCAQRGVAADAPAENLEGVKCKDLPTLVPYNMLPTAKEDLKVMKKMLACGIPFAYVRWTDGAGHVLRGSVRMATALRGRMNAEMRAKVARVAPGGWLRGKPLENLVRDTWLSLNVSHPRYFLGMPIPACLEGLHNERLTGGTAALRWVDFYITGNEKTQSKGKLMKSTPNEYFEGKFMPSLARWSYSSLFTHQNGDEALAMLKALAKRKGTVVIASHGLKATAEKKKLGWDVYGMPSELYLEWEGETRENHIAAMVKMAKESKGRVFLCSFSAVCAIFFHRMWEVSQDNWYIVTGTALDAIAGDDTRSWIHNKCTKLGKECTFYRSTYHWGTFNGFNGGIIPHATGSWKRKTGCSARQPFSVEFIRPVE